MGKKHKASEVGVLTLSALSVIMAAIIDTMRYADVPNETVHMFLGQLEEGFDNVLIGEARIIMLDLVHILTLGVPCND